MTMKVGNPASVALPSAESMRASLGCPMRAHSIGAFGKNTWKMRMIYDLVVATPL